MPPDRFPPDDPRQDKGHLSNDGRRIDALLRELRRRLENLYGHHVRGVYLYGSYARGQADGESDVDILVVLDDFESYGQEIRRTGQIGADLSLDYGVSISQVFMRERDWAEADTPFLANVREEAIPA